MHLYRLAVLCFFPLLAFAKSNNRLIDIDTVDKYLNLCPESEGLKEHPSPEPELTMCGEWKSNSCCSASTAEQIADSSLNGFDFDFCGKMDRSCRDFFHYDYCMVSCSPDLGPWIVKLSRSRFKEKVFKVPLCESDCNAWYNACASSKACSFNWKSGGFDWSEGTNKCRDGFECLEISKIYGSARTFCENVWDHSYRFVPVESVDVWNSTDAHCMHIPMGPDDSKAKTKIEHNHEVARRYAKNIIKRVYGREN